jgi:hypothetical protein
MAYPGCNCLNPFCGETVAGRLSLRVQQLEVRCETKTKDNVSLVCLLTCLAGSWCLMASSVVLAPYQATSDPLVYAAHSLHCVWQQDLPSWTPLPASATQV